MCNTQKILCYSSVSNISFPCYTIYLLSESTKSKFTQTFLFQRRTAYCRQFEVEQGQDCGLLGCGLIITCQITRRHNPEHRTLKHSPALRGSNLSTTASPASCTQGRRLRVACGATAPGPALEGAQRFRPMSFSSYILR